MEDDLTELEENLGISGIDVDAIHMFEFFSSLQRAGFNERQALTLVSLFGGADAYEVVHVEEDPEGDDGE